MPVVQCRAVRVASQIAEVGATRVQPWQLVTKTKLEMNEFVWAYYLILKYSNAPHKSLDAKSGLKVLDQPHWSNYLSAAIELVPALVRPVCTSCKRELDELCTWAGCPNECWG